VLAVQLHERLAQHPVHQRHVGGVCHEAVVDELATSRVLSDTRLRRPALNSSPHLADAA
jgi:hypothetical protein